MVVVVIAEVVAVVVAAVMRGRGHGKTGQWVTVRKAPRGRARNRAGAGGGRSAGEGAMGTRKEVRGAWQPRGRDSV